MTTVRNGVRIATGEPGAHYNTFGGDMWYGSKMCGQRGVGRVKVPGGQNSGLSAFWNLWDLCTQFNLQTGVKAMRASLGLCYLLLTQPGKQFGSKHPPAL